MELRGYFFISWLPVQQPGIIIYHKNNLMNFALSHVTHVSFSIVYSALYPYGRITTHTEFLINNL